MLRLFPFMKPSHFQLRLQASDQFYLPQTQQSVDGRISSEPAWLVTVKDEKCLVYCECKQCEMGNPAYLWNAVLCRQRNIPRLARVTAGRWRGDIGSSLDTGQNHHQMDRNTDTSVDMDFHNLGAGSCLKTPTSAFTFKTLLRHYKK